MNDSISKILFPELDSSVSKKSRSFNKDLFSQKLGHTILVDSLCNKKELSRIKRNNLYNINKNSKNKTIIFSSIDKEENKISNILNKLNIPFIPQKNNYWIMENNNIIKSKTLLNEYPNNKYTKKQIKKLISMNPKIYNNKYIEKKAEISNNKKENENSFKSIKKLNNNKISNELHLINIKKNFISKENSKEILGYSENDYKKLNLQKNKNKKITISSLPNINENDKNSIMFIIKFYESFIELYYSYDSEKYISVINDFNQTFFFLFDIKSFPKTSMNDIFLDSFKYSSILIICLIFLSKDEKLYKDTMIKMKEYLNIFLLFCLNKVNDKVLESKEIYNFIENNKISIEDKSLVEILNMIISLLFNDKMNDYKKLRKCVKQLTNNISEITSEKILNIVNDVILFCHNCSYYLEENDSKKKKKNKKEKIICEENKEINKNEDKNTKNIQGPFIKNKMKKKFCLVLDLDETLIHNLNLPFGDYFFLRPGVCEFIEKTHEFYELIIFTAGHKNYAYSIIDKIDYKNYIDYILYKKHIIFEDGKPIKKLDLIGRDLNKTIFVDNLENNAKYNKKNLYRISSWYNNIYDNELYKLKEKLINIATSGKFDEDITKGLI